MDRLLPVLLVLALASGPALAQVGTTNGNGPGGFTTTPPEPPKPDSYTINPPSPPPNSPDSLVSNPKPKKPDPDPVDLPTPARDSSADSSRGESTADVEAAPDSTTPEAPADIPGGENANAVKGTLVRGLDEGAGFAPLNSQSEPESAETPEFESAQVLVQTSDMDSARAIQNELAAEGYRVRGRRIYRALGVVVMNLRTPPDIPVPVAVAMLRSRFPTAEIAANHLYRPLAATDQREYGRTLIGWEAAPPCAASLRIGMIDTPVSAEHPALAGARLRTDSVLPAGAAPADGDHGTAIASLLVGNGADALAGLLPGAELVAVNAFRAAAKDAMDSNTELLLAALDSLLGDAVSVLNLSFGGPDNRLLEVAMTSFHDAGIPVIAAAGNERSRGPVYPAAYPSVIAVTALDAEQRIMRGAVEGGYVDIAAPGVDVWAARADGGGRYYSGTSFAVPFVSAMAAVLRHAAAGSEDTTRALLTTTTDLGDAGKDPVYGNGLLRWSPRC